MNAKVVVLLSGGLDSTVLCAHLQWEGMEVIPVSFDYGQRHRCELEAARQVVNVLGLAHRHRIVDLSSLAAVLHGSALTDPRVALPEGHYEDVSMKATVVPNRNAILLSVAIGVAIAEGADSVALGAHAGDHAIYPDCRKEFMEAMREVARLCHYAPVELLSPFVGWTKADVVRRGRAVGAPMDVSWCCYAGGTKHCGRCGTCVERKESFPLAHVPDRTIYA